MAGNYLTLSEEASYIDVVDGTVRFRFYTTQTGGDYLYIAVDGSTICNSYYSLTDASATYYLRYNHTVTIMEDTPLRKVIDIRGVPTSSSSGGGSTLQDNNGDDVEVVARWTIEHGRAFIEHSFVFAAAGRYITLSSSITTNSIMRMYFGSYAANLTNESNVYESSGSEIDGGASATRASAKYLALLSDEIDMMVGHVVASLSGTADLEYYEVSSGSIYQYLYNGTVYAGDYILSYLFWDVSGSQTEATRIAMGDDALDTTQAALTTGDWVNDLNVPAMIPGEAKPDTANDTLNTDHALANGLVGAWVLNEGTGNPVDVVDSITLTKGADATWVAAGLDFDGTANSTCGNTSPPAALDSDTYTVVIKLQGDAVPTTGYAVPISKRATVGTQSNFSWDHDTATFRQAWALRNTGGVWKAAKYTTALQANTPYVLGVTLDSGDFKAYLNGELETTTTSSGTPSSGNGSFTIGSDYISSAYADHFSGVIEYVFVWDRALSAAEMAQVFANPFQVFAHGFASDGAWHAEVHDATTKPTDGSADEALNTDHDLYTDLALMAVLNEGSGAPKNLITDTAASTNTASWTTGDEGDEIDLDAGDVVGWNDQDYDLDTGTVSVLLAVDSMAADALAKIVFTNVSGSTGLSASYITQTGGTALKWSITYGTAYTTGIDHTVSAGELILWTFVFRGSLDDVDIYRDGVWTETIGKGNFALSTADMKLGFANASYAMDGKVAYFAVWDGRILTADEILSHARRRYQMFANADDLTIPWDTTRYNPSLVVHDFPVLTGSGAGTDRRIGHYKCNDDAASSTVVDETGTADATWIVNATEAGRNTNNDSVAGAHNKALSTGGLYALSLPAAQHPNSFFLEGAVRIKFSPKFAYNTSSHQTLMEWNYNDGTTNNRIYISYTATNDRFDFAVVYGGTTTLVSTTSFGAGDLLEDGWFDIQAWWSDSLGKMGLILNGQIIGEGTLSGTPTTSNCDVFFIGTDDNRTTYPGEFYIDTVETFGTPILPYGAMIPANVEADYSDAHALIDLLLVGDETDGSSYSIGSTGTVDIYGSPSTITGPDGITSVYDYTGSDDYGILPKEYVNGKDTFTISFWYKQTIGTYNTYTDVMVGDAAGATWYYFTVTNQATDSDKLKVVCGSTSNTHMLFDDIKFSTTAGELGDGNWHFIEIQIDHTQSTNNTKVRGWMDGVESAQTSSGTISKQTLTADFHMWNISGGGEQIGGAVFNFTVYDGLRMSGPFALGAGPLQAPKVSQ